MPLNEFIGTLWVEFQRGLAEDGVVTGPEAQDELPYAPDAALPFGPFGLRFGRVNAILSAMPYPRASRVWLNFVAKPSLEDTAEATGENYLC